MVKVIVLIILILVSIGLSLLYYDPAIERISFNGYKETRIWYNKWEKIRDKDVFTREYTVLYRKKINDENNK